MIYTVQMMKAKVKIDEKLQAGNYVLEEIKAPKGYVVARSAVFHS